MLFRGPILFCLLVSLLCLWAARVADASSAPYSEVYGEPIFKQKLSFLSAETFRTSPQSPIKTDCEFAAAVIRKYSRPSEGLVLESTCEYQPGLQDYLVRTTLFLHEVPGKRRKPFRKTTTRVLYRREESALYAARVLKELNLHKCNVLIDPVRRGRSVSLDTIALVSASKQAKRRKVAARK